MTNAEKQPRLSARALVVHEGRLLLVNATSSKGDGKWCVPGGGADAGRTLKENLAREVYEETGLTADIGDMAVASEFFDRATGFHQVDLFFYATVEDASFPEHWRDCADVVEHRGFFTLEQMGGMAVFPAFLKTGFWLDMRKADNIYQGWEEKS